MSRKKAPSPPKYASTLTMQDGTITGKSYKDKKGNIVNETYSDPSDLTLKKENQGRLATLYGQLGNYTDQQNTDANNAYNSYVDQQTNAFKDKFDPIIRSQREDNANRFGTTHNSIYNDDFADIEKAQSYGLSDIMQNAAQQKQDYFNNVDNQTLKYISALQGNIDTANNLAGNTFTQNSQLSNQGNSYAESLYNALLNKYNAENSKAGIGGQLIGAGASLGSAALSNLPAITAAL